MDEKLYGPPKGENPVMWQIEYERPTQTEEERDFGGDMLSVETLSCLDPTNPEARKYLHDVLDDFLDNCLHKPETAKFWIGGICEHHAKK